ncbi:jhy protein homolog isoform X2 [Triplophysa dalaica]|uniref:jhy protein homolog isoform X2 n=1 Tax=Triplophysa dalaica TaxID=1582913 RepID=UPI0024DF8906|nr:jhy protein homolog isoform X2 [Triplophysa dalaica]
MKTVISEQQGHQGHKSNVKFSMLRDARHATQMDEAPSLPMLWDSLESDTESLVQEKTYQRELQMRIAQDGDLPSAEKSKQGSDRGGSQYRDGLHDEPLRQTDPEDEYADLRYDPNWRQNLESAEFLNQLKERLSLDSFEESEDSLEPLEDVAGGRRQEYTVVSNQLASETDAALFPQPLSPFHLHPQKETSGQKRSYQDPLAVNPVNAREDIVERNKTTLGINTHKQGSYLRAHRQRDQNDEIKQPRRTSCGTISTCSPESQDNARDPELMWLQKAQKLKLSHKERKDPKKRERTNNHSDHLKPQVPEAKSRPSVHLKPLAERTISADHLPQADSEDHVFLDPPVAFSYSHDLASHSNAAPTVNLNINLHSPANPSQPLNLTQQKTIFTLVSQALQWERPDLFNQTVVQPVYPFHPSVPLNAIGQMGLAPQSSISSPVSHTGVVHRKYAIDRDATQGIEKRHAGKPLLNAFENASFKNHNTMRIPVLRLPTPSEAETSHYPPELMPTDEGPFVPHSQISGAYTVLPPIGRSNARDTELCSDRSEQQLNPIHRSSSEGYLSQMERHRQLKAKTNYKPYTMKDFTNLRQELKLGGLGPTNTIPEAVAEKIRRQKLYSNVIREQNKKISRIPSLSAKDPVGSDNKDTIPRRKALEYAKTIAKPKAPPKTNDRPREKYLSMQAPYLQEMDPMQLATIEMLRRHEEEKRAVARFKTIQAI